MKIHPGSSWIGGGLEDDVSGGLRGNPGPTVEPKRSDFFSATEVQLGGGCCQCRGGFVGEICRNPLSIY